MSSDKACIYACLLLNDGGVPIAYEALAKVFEAANSLVDSFPITNFA